jgi:hypothetical protein
MAVLSIFTRSPDWKWPLWVSKKEQFFCGMYGSFVAWSARKTPRDGGLLARAGSPCWPICPSEKKHDQKFLEGLTAVLGFRRWHSMGIGEAGRPQIASVQSYVNSRLWSTRPAARQDYKLRRSGGMKRRNVINQSRSLNSGLATRTTQEDFNGSAVFASQRWHGSKHAR